MSIIDINHSKSTPNIHSFHLPVMGLGYTIDSPIKVARFGIDSCVSIMEDGLIESMRKVLCRKFMEPYLTIDTKSEDARAKRITAYLNLLHKIVNDQITQLKAESFEDAGSNITKYFEMLPISQPFARLYEVMRNAKHQARIELQEVLRQGIRPGRIDVNIMTKVDKLNYNEKGQALPREFSDALSALRGYAMSDLCSSVVFSAGMNPALFTYLEQFDDFFPDENGKIKKGVILKVSDFRSALIQGKFLANKGLWIREFRIESGLNCGGHAFATEGNLMGPILEEFKSKRTELEAELFKICQTALSDKNRNLLDKNSKVRITAQGGIGNFEEDQLLLNHYQLDGTGWGSPFLLVPEATSVDKDTLNRILEAKESDFFLSHASPLGVPFNNLRISSGEDQRKERIKKNRPGSPCYKKTLSFDTEFTKIPICTSSRQYQHLKLKQLKKTGSDNFEHEASIILEKDCLCEGLSAPVLLANGVRPDRNLEAVTICPGPNLAYFKGVYSLREMIDHIYGKTSLHQEVNRPYFLIKELQLYMDHLKKEIQQFKLAPDRKWQKNLQSFKSNLETSIIYYKGLFSEVIEKPKDLVQATQNELDNALLFLKRINIDLD
ncbi:hypothetical protein IFO69_11310 [Echinicola sp. CAU 1574]|uniref:Uncharacterized protein n=1 Tax=Echinicola arenosa TaxID=2774144 RepID=A0ABR9ALU1_9BACT|nr:hypothetical protein [Echinicola arenosa]MBD8489332.1 hypothetical protein [Echinicola arenosa]